MKHYKVYIDGQEIQMHTARVSAQRFNRVWRGRQRNTDQTETAYYVEFDLEKPVELTVCIDSEKIEKVEIRPAYKKYPYGVTENEVKIEVKEPGHFTVEVNGWHEALTVFVNPSEKYIPRKNDIYFGPGEHDAGLIMPEDGQRIYIDRNATVYGTIYAIGKTGVSVEGRGVLDASKYLRPWLRRLNGEIAKEWPSDYEKVPDITNQINDGYSDLLIREMREKGLKYEYSYPMGIITAYGCKDLKISGIILKDSFLWTLILRNACENVVIDNIKIIGQWRYNSDGINICDSNNVTVKNCFVRSYDDCIVVRGGYLISGYGYGCHNVTIENNVLWCDWGKCFEIWSGDCDSEIENIRYKNNYAIRVSHIVMSIDTWFGCDNTTVKNIFYDHIYVEYDQVHPIEQLQLNETDTYDENKTERNENLILIRTLKLGQKNLGNQHFGAFDESKKLNVTYKDIIYNSIEENYPYGEILVKKEGISELSNVVFEGEDIMKKVGKRDGSCGEGQK